MLECIYRFPDNIGNFIMKNQQIPKITNDGGKKTLTIKYKKFNCLGAKPPHDHPHTFLDIGSKLEIICPYCGTLYKYKA